MNQPAVDWKKILLAVVVRGEDDLTIAWNQDYALTSEDLDALGALLIDGIQREKKRRFKQPTIVVPKTQH